MSHVLVKWADNWADEMDLEGFRVYEVSKWDVLKEKLKKHTESFTICVGTNEEIDYDDGEALLGSISVTAITDEEVAVLKKLFKGQHGEQSVFDNADKIVKQKQFLF